MLSDPKLRWALGYIRPYAGRLATVLVLSLTSTALSLYVPYLSKGLVDVALIGRNIEALLRIVAAFMGITLASFALNAIAGLRYTRVSAEILFDMRLDLYRHLQQLSPTFYTKMPLGQIVSRLNADISEIQRVMSEAALAWFGHIVALVGTIGFLIWLDWQLFLVSLVVLPLALWALVAYRRRLEQAVRAMRERSAAIGTFLIESLRGMSVIVGFNAQQREVDKFRTANNAFIDALMWMRRTTYFSGGLPGLLLALGTSIVFIYGGSRVINGVITMGTLVAFVTYQMRLMSPVQGLMGLYTNIATARVSLQRVAEILDAPISVADPEHAIALPKAQGSVAFDNVTFTYDRSAPVLQDASFAVKAGEYVAVVGRSGQGKSTIADLLTRHIDPTSGRITLDGHDLKDLRLHDIRSNVSVVQQEPFIFNATIADNVRFANPNATSDAIERAVKEAGLAKFVAQQPEGLDTEVGEGGRALSAGERQRVAIARALLADPAILILDEATASLDPATEADVMRGYEVVMQNRTTIAITHRPALARRADRVIVIEDGQIVESGAPKTLLEQHGTFASLFGPETSS